MPASRPLVRAGALVALALAAGAAPAVAAVSPPPGWGRAQAVPNVPGAGGPDPVEPAFVVEPGGAVSALVGTRAGLVEVARRAPGGRWAAARRLGAAAATPHVAASGGAAVAAWRAGGQVLAATRSGAGAWSRPVALAASGARWVGVAVAPGGRAAVAWTAGDRAWVAVRPEGRGRFGAARALGAAADTPSRPMVLAAGPDGTLAAGWRAPGGQPQAAVLTPARRAFGPSEALPAGPADREAPALGVGAGGQVTAAWSDAQGVLAADRPADGRWGPAVRVWTCRVGDAPCAEVGDPELAAGADGRTSALWSSREAAGTGAPLHAAVRPAPGAAWVDSGDFFGGFHRSSRPLVRATAAGWVAVWGNIGTQPGDGSVQVAGLPAGVDRWGAARYLFLGSRGGARPAADAPVGGEPIALSADGDGLHVAAWVVSAEVGGRTRVRIVAAVGRPL
ncbi:MAG: hypothetical protein MUE51_15995, partial [Thermoleophilia bacterium]|nr:hypothetical protein [Thermoleophilia bacterium]